MAIFRRNQVIVDPITGIPANVSGTGQLHVVLEGEVLTGNSSAIPLNAGITFPGASVDTLEYAMIIINVFADQVSAVDGLDVLFSSDNVNWDHSDTFTIPANTGKTFSFQTVARYMKVEYTNGGVNQGVFRLQTVGKKGYSKPSSHRIADSISGQDDAELVKSVLTGEDPDGVFGNVGISLTGNLKITDAENGLAIAKGEVIGSSFVHKFGNAPDFDTSDGEVTIWDGAEDGTAWELMNYVYSATDDIDSISSSDGADTQDITIEGLDINYNVVIQTITLNGQVTVPLDTDLLRVYRAFNTNSVDLVGHIFIWVAGGGSTGGVPDTNADIRAIIDPVNQQTEMAVFTVPNGKTGYMRDWYASTAGANRDSNYPIRLKSRELGGVFRIKHTSAIADAGTSAYQHDYVEPEIFLAKTDIEMVCEMTASGGTQGSVSSGFDIVLVDN